MNGQLGKSQLGNFQLGSLGGSTAVRPSFAVAGQIAAIFTATPIRAIRVAGVISATFVTGGTVIIGGAFRHTGAVVAVFSVPPAGGFRVEGDVSAAFYTRGGQEAKCIAGPGVPAAGGSVPMNAVY